MLNEHKKLLLELIDFAHITWPISQYSSLAWSLAEQQGIAIETAALTFRSFVKALELDFKCNCVRLSHKAW